MADNPLEVKAREVLERHGIEAPASGGFMHRANVAIGPAVVASMLAFAREIASPTTAISSAVATPDQMAGVDGEVTQDTLDRVGEAIVRAGCPGREGPYGGYDYGYNEEFYGPAPKEGRYVVRDYRAVGSPTWGAWVHHTNDRDEHEAAFRRLTRRHIASEALKAAALSHDTTQRSEKGE